MNFRNSQNRQLRNHLAEEQISKAVKVVSLNLTITPNPDLDPEFCLYLQKKQWKN
jgi:hypothetical protein